MSRPLLRRLGAAVVGLLATSLAMSACSPAQQTNKPFGESVTVTVRVWDNQIQKAYEKSFAEFTKKNPNINVKVTLVPWKEYFDKLHNDVGAKNADDVFMMNSSYLEPYIKSNDIFPIGSEFDSQKSGWLKAAVEQYTLDGKLWGVPQLTDGGIAMYVNTDLLDKAGLKVSDVQDLTWVPGGGAGDTFLPVAKKLTLDAAGKRGNEAGFDATKCAQWGYNAAQDLQNIYYNYIGSNGGSFQDDRNKFTFASSQSQEAFQYLVDLINKHHVSPGAADTNDNGDFTRDQFLQGKIAMFQSGVYNLKNVADGAKFAWTIVPMPAGPKGRVSVVNNVIIAGNNNSKHKAETIKVMQWLGSTDGAKFIGSEGAGLPAVTGAAPAFNEFWKAKNVDPSPFAKAGEGKTTRAPAGSHYGAAYKAWKPIFDEIFLGRKPVTDLKTAEDAANKAMGG